MSLKLKVAVAHLLLGAVLCAFCGCAAPLVASATQSDEASPESPYYGVSTYEEFVAMHPPTRETPANSVGLRPGEERLAPLPSFEQVVFVDADLEDVKWRVEHRERGEIFLDFVKNEQGERLAAFGVLEFLGEDDQVVRFRVVNPTLLTYRQCVHRLESLRGANEPSLMTLRVLLGWRRGVMARLSEDGTTVFGEKE